MIILTNSTERSKVLRRKEHWEPQLEEKVSPQAGSRKSRTQASTAYDRVREDILAGVIPAGSKLKTRDLCARYDMGLSAIREALNRLCRDGMVRQEDLKGFSVLPLTADDLHQLTMARCWLNEIALRQSILHGDGAWEERILIAFHRMSKTQKFLSESPQIANPEWEKAHRVFHSSLIAACPSHWILGFCEHLFDAANRYRSLSRSNPADRPDDHGAIMDATIARDADKAVRLLTSHFETTANLVCAALTAQTSAQRP